MPNYTVSITDTQKKCLDYGIVGIQTWIENAIEAQINYSQQEIIDENTKHCNKNNIAIAVGISSQIDQAYAIGAVKTAEQRNADFNLPG